MIWEPAVWGMIGPWLRDGISMAAGSIDRIGIQGGQQCLSYDGSWTVGYQAYLSEAFTPVWFDLFDIENLSFGAVNSSSRLVCDVKGKGRSKFPTILQPRVRGIEERSTGAAKLAKYKYKNTCRSFGLGPALPERASEILAWSFDCIPSSLYVQLAVSQCDTDLMTE